MITNTSSMLKAIKECRVDPPLSTHIHHPRWTHPQPQPPTSLTPSTSYSGRGPTFPLALLSCSGGSDGEVTVGKWQLKNTLPSLYFIPTATHPLRPSLPQRYPIHLVASPPLGSFGSFDPVFPLASARSLTQSISTTRSQSWI